MSKFKQLLIEETCLLSLSQGDCDLLLAAQANSITYSQLSLSALHGTTRSSGRLSLKHLEREGLLTSREIPGTGREKYYLLTPKGRKRLEHVFGTEFLKRYSIDPDRRMPTGSQQIPHRILTGDLYFCYLSNPFLDKLPVWQIESAYQGQGDKAAGPRCDAMLKTPRMTYYIEQDNSTQGRNALSVKLLQYMEAPCFLGGGMEENRLIFTVNCESKERGIQLSPYSVYRILLKARRLWKYLEQESGESLTFEEFGKRLVGGDNPSTILLTESDIRILERFSALYPSYGYEGLEKLTGQYLHDPSFEEERRRGQDALFHKRLKLAFYPFLDDPDHATLQYRLRKGLFLAAIPNHRLNDHLPFLLQPEYRFRDFLCHILYSMGISEMELWSYQESCTVRDGGGQEFFFRNVFTCEECACLIIAEDIVHEIGARERLRHYLEQHRPDRTVLFLCFVTDRKEASLFLAENRASLAGYQNRGTALCFLDESQELFSNPDLQDAYYESGGRWCRAQLSFDRFLGDLSLTERRA